MYDLGAETRAKLWVLLEPLRKAHANVARALELALTEGERERLAKMDPLELNACLGFVDLLDQGVVASPPRSTGDHH
jgi:hypothetical protein